MITEQFEQIPVDATIFKKLDVPLSQFIKMTPLKVQLTTENDQITNIQIDKADSGASFKKDADGSSKEDNTSSSLPRAAGAPSSLPKAPAEAVSAASTLPRAK